MSDAPQQGPCETVSERLDRAPNVLEAYARDVERYGKPLDSGLPSLLRFVAEQLRARDALAAEEEGGWKRGFPKRSGMYLVCLSDGEQIVTHWNDGRGKNADTWGDERPHGWGAIRDWPGRVVAWRPLSAPPVPKASP